MYVVFHLWYGGRGKPMSRSEIDQRLKAIQLASSHQPQNTDLTNGEIFDELRRLAEHDDGNEFYMVNLTCFRDSALYPPGSPFSGSAAEADARYNQALMPYLLKHGGVPVFVGKQQGRFIDSPDDTEWQRIAIVRYRSRRDMLKMALQIAPLDVVIHKWAAIEKTQVFPVRTILNLFAIRTMVAVALFVPAFAVHLIVRNVLG